MPKIKYAPCPHYVELEFTDGKIRKLQGSPSEMRLYFVDYVMDAVNIYNSGFREIRLYDNAHRLFKSYCQHF